MLCVCMMFSESNVWAPGFLPAHSSTPVHFPEPRTLFDGKRRVQSFAGNPERRPLVCSRIYITHIYMRFISDFQTKLLSD